LSLWMKSSSVTIQTEAAEQCFPVVLFIILYKVILTFETVDEILKCDHSNESYRALLSYGAIMVVSPSVLLTPLCRRLSNVVAEYYLK